MIKRNINRYKRLARGLHAARKHKKYIAPVVNTAVMAAKAYAMAKALKKSTNIEYKIADITDNASVSFSGYLAQLNNISQGITDSTRVGDSCKIQNLVFRTLLARNGADAQMRLILFWDKQAKVTSSSDILQNTGTIFSPLSPKNYDKRFQTKILYDKVFNLNTDNPMRSLDLVIPINQHTQYNGATNLVNTGYLGVLFISNINTANNPTMNYSIS